MITYIHCDLFSLLWKEEKSEREKTGKAREEKEKSLSLSLSLCVSMKGSYVLLFAVVLHRTLSIIDRTCVCIASQRQIRTGSKYP